MPILAMMFSCSGNNKQAISETEKQEIKVIEQSEEKLISVADSASAVIDTLQSDIDELLK